MVEPISAPADGREPVVSVLMCVYNGGPFLDEALGSIRHQTLRDLEILLVDDGSTDDTPATLRRHASEDARIRIISIAHSGPAAARNAGLRHARARLVALMDADDVAEPERLSIQSDYMDRNRDVVALGTSIWHIGQRGRRISGSDVGPATRDELARLVAGHKAVFLYTPTVMLDRDAVQDVGGFRAEMVPAEDVDLWTRLSEGHIVLSLRQRLLRYRVHGHSISTSRFFEQMERLGLIEENLRRRAAGLPELAPEEYGAQLRRDPLLQRANRVRVAHARYHYRVAGAQVADSEPTGMAHLALAMTLAPEIIVPRLFRQLRPAIRG